MDGSIENLNEWRCLNGMNKWINRWMYEVDLGG